LETHKQATNANKNAKHDWVGNARNADWKLGQEVSFNHLFNERQFTNTNDSKCD